MKQASSFVPVGHGEGGVASAPLKRSSSTLNHAVNRIRLSVYTVIYTS